jgi:hypothetical protein
MAGIVTNSTRDSGGNCEHLSLTALLDGESISFKTGVHDSRWAIPLDDEEKVLLCRLLARWWKGKGGNLADFVNRVLIGEEGSNVKLYSFFGPGAAITKTNIGTSYVNICSGLNGERQVIDFTGCTQFRLILHANLIGTGQWGARVVRDSDNTVLIDQPNLGAAGERELDSDWQNLPAAFLGQGMMFMRAQAKSTTGADDPVFRSLTLGVR